MSNRRVSAPDFPMAGTLSLIGDLYVRVDRPDDARAVWRGAACSPTIRASRAGRPRADGADATARPGGHGSITARRIDHEMGRSSLARAGTHGTSDRGEPHRLDVYMAPADRRLLQGFQMHRRDRV